MDTDQKNKSVPKTSRAAAVWKYRFSREGRIPFFRNRAKEMPRRIREGSLVRDGVNGVEQTDGDHQRQEIDEIIPDVFPHIAEDQFT